MNTFLSRGSLLLALVSFVGVAACSSTDDKEGGNGGSGGNAGGSAGTTSGGSGGASGSGVTAGAAGTSAGAAGSTAGAAGSTAGASGTAGSGGQATGCAPAKVGLAVKQTLAVSQGDIRGLATADFNKDGKADLVFTAGKDTSRGVYLALGKGAGAFEASKYFDFSNAGYANAVGDFDGNGSADFLSIGYSTNKPGGTLWLGKGDGTFNNPSTFDPEPTYAGDVKSVAAADFNGDGKLDFVHVNESRYATVVLNPGTGAFTAGVNLPEKERTESRLAVGDVTGDGAPDIVLPIYDASAHTIHVVPNQNGSFTTAPIVLPLPGTVYEVKGLSLGDLNGDGKLDIVVGASLSQSDGGGLLIVLLNTGNSTFAPAVKYENKGGELTEVRVAEMNNDGHPDVVAYDRDSKAVAVFLNAGDGTFGTAPSLYPAGDIGSNSPLRDSSHLVVGDFDGKGLNGVAVIGTTGIDVLSAICKP